MKHYIVKIDIRIGEYEKGNKYFIMADDEYLAGHMALYLEAHNPDTLEWEADCNSVTDMFGEMIYTVHSAKLVRKEDVAILREYLGEWQVDMRQLAASSSYLEVRNGSI